MMRSKFTFLFALICCVGVMPGSAWADEIDDLLGDDDESVSTEPEPEVVTKEDLPEIGEDQLAVFVLDRGIYVSSDLGVFVTVGNVNGNSNVQPYLAVNAGMDFGEHFSAQLALSSAYVSQNPVTEYDLPGNSAGRQIANFDMLNLGVQVVASLRPTTRFAIEPKVGGGLTRLEPALTDPNNPNPTEGMSPWTGHIVGGIDFKYLTLLTDFTAGLSTNVYMVFGPEPIIGLSGAFLVRYTFG